MAIVTKHVSMVKVDGLDYEDHISRHYGPSVTIEAMDQLGVAFTSYDDSDSRIVICLQADSTNQAALDACVAQGLMAWGAIELTEAADPDATTGLVTVAGALQPAQTIIDPDGVSEDWTAPLVDTGNNKLKRDVTPT